MERGTAVLVRVYPDKTVERVVWEEKKTYIIVCRREVYDAAIRSGKEPDSSMGFPKEDVSKATACR